ncbi:hypothetical protein [Streptomyces noursei]|uniref:hypothetical protein n=1 Tax=Streptomyces noursei TaxID=1971 RepID=UPI0035E36DE7
MNEVDLTDRVDLAVRALVRPAPRFPEAVDGLPLGMELSGLGLRTSVAAEVDGVEMVQMSERYALRFATMPEEAG